MAVVTGIRLIVRTLAAGNVILSLPHAMVDFKPKVKYKYEKANAFDPTYIHRREPYHVDEFALASPVTSAEYGALYDYLNRDDALQYYLEYRSNGVLKQFPVDISDFPECPDDLHEHPATVKFSAVSRYVGNPGFVNFDGFAIADQDEVVINTGA